jgi:drug/metabolite transporter (DMT)-like permease
VTDGPAGSERTGDERAGRGDDGSASRRTEERTGTLAAAGASALFGSSYVATAFALHSFGPLAVAFWRGLGAALIVGVALRAGWLGVPVGARAHPFDRGRLLRLAALGLLGGPIFIVALNVAVGASGATIASFVAGLYAVLAAVLAPFVLRERLGRAAIAGFVVALAGTALLAEIESGAPSAGGVGAGLIAAATFAAYLVLSRRWSRAIALSGGVIAMANFVATAIVLVPAVVLLGSGGFVPPTIAPDAGLAIVWLVVGPSVLAQLLLIASVRRVPARRSSAFLLLNPIVATVLAAVLLGERLAPSQTVGAGLVLVGIALAAGLVGGRSHPDDGGSTATSTAGSGVTATD